MYNFLFNSVPVDLFVAGYTSLAMSVLSDWQITMETGKLQMTLTLCTLYSEEGLSFRNNIDAWLNVCIINDM